MTQKKKRGGVNKKRKVGPAKRLTKIVSQTIANRRAAAADRKAKADQEMKEAVARGLKAVTPAEIAAINANPKLARKINEEAAVQAAAEYGINIRKPNGKIDTRLARKAAEAAAIQAAAELGVDIRNKRGGIRRRKALQAARLADAARAGKEVSAQAKAAVERQDAKMAAAIKEAQQRGFSLAQLAGNAIQSDPGLAQQVSEEAIIQTAAEMGIDIYHADGQIDRQKAREVGQISAILTAAEMGIDITNSRGKISRRKALEAAKLADAARAGKPVSAQVRAAVSRQDARITAALRAAERRGENPNQVVGSGSRRDAYSDAELAALMRRHIKRSF